MSDKRLGADFTIKEVPLTKMRAREGVSQRPFRPAWAQKLAQEFDPNLLGNPVVNHVGEWYWLLDGQHRVGALKLWIAANGDDWQTWTIPCRVYSGLTEQQEARKFDGLNTYKSVDLFSKFQTRLHGGYEEETNVDAIVRLNKLKIARERDSGCVSCVGTLLKVYRRSDDALNRTLHVAYWAFSDAGLESDVIDGLGTLVGRYDGQIEDKRLIDALKELHGGVSTLRQRAQRNKQQYGGPTAHCIAAAAVDAYNKTKGKKLPTWWKAIATEDSP